MRTSSFEQSGDDENAIGIAFKPPYGWSGLIYPSLYPTEYMYKSYIYGRIQQEEYKDQYMTLLIKQRGLTPQQVVADLLALSHDPILLCHCDLSKKPFCHRMLVAAWIAPIVGEVLELNPPRKQPRPKPAQAHNLDEYE